MIPEVMSQLGRSESETTFVDDAAPEKGERDDCEDRPPHAHADRHCMSDVIWVRA